MIAKVIQMNGLLEQALLYDFYGELLTDHQKEIYEQFVLEDLSLSEIAESAGISRQGVHDLVKRCNKILEGYEAKLHLVDKFLSIRDKVQKMNELLENNGECSFTELIVRKENLLDIVCAFMALLEAVKFKMASIYQNRMFGDIKIRPYQAA